MDSTRIVRLSRYLSKHLRHQPQALGLTLAPGGWVAVSDLLAACAQHGQPLSHVELDEIVANNNKQRFSYDETGERIRANQGHSVAVDLQLAPVVPPETLYHGTGERAVASIQREGLKRMKRHHVHLSPDTPTAVNVGKRHGHPVVFAVAARAMSCDGHSFYLSENGVWLTDNVPPRYLTLVDAG